MNFEQLTYQIKDKLYRFSLRITGNAPEAEDVVQEVFIKVWEKRDDMTDIKNPEAWCMTLTKNLSFDKLRSKHHRPDDISEAYTLSDSKSSPYIEVETNDLMHNIRIFMDLLPEKQKLVMHLRDIEGLSYDEIAENLDMPMPQVKVYLHRARTTIREKILESDNFKLE
jgi:RNA polymerase sigma factor (sigma-70 family)